MDAALLDEARKKKGRKNSIWAGTGLLLVIVLTAVLIGRLQPLSMSVALGMAGATAFGTLAMAWLVSRGSAVQAWAWWTAASVMAAGIMLSVFVVGDPVVWKKEVHASAWMLPWLLLVMGTTGDRRSSACAPAGSRAAWLVVGTAAVLTVLLLGLPLIVNQVFGG